jgi:myo-inositol 2-dehydrogenase / D-chiro-inositol 1-dehydrogenase
MRIAFVGAGAITLRHLAALRDVPGLDVAGICDPQHARARAACALLGGEAYAGWEEMLDEQRPDALLVCTPTFAHRDPAVAALGRGVHVYVEKPLARTLEDARAIVAAWEASDAVCAVGFQWRSVDFLDAIRTLLREAPLAMLISRSLGPAEPGRLEQIAAAEPGREPWFMQPRLGGGQLFELASHDIDLQLALAGPVVRVQAASGVRRVAQADLPPSALPDTIALTLQFASGALGTIQVVWVGPQIQPVYSLDVIAPELALHVSLDPDFEIRGDAHGRPIHARVGAHPRLRTLEHFVAAVRARDRLAVPCTPRDGLAAVAVAIACEEAIATGQTVEVVT